MRGLDTTQAHEERSLPSRRQSLPPGPRFLILQAQELEQVTGVDKNKDDVSSATI